MQAKSNSSSGGAQSMQTKSVIVQALNSMWRNAGRSARALTLILGVLVLSVAARGQVRISAVYGGGGLSASGYNADYVELFNAGATAQSLTGWSLQYQGATTTGAFVASGKIDLAGTIQPGRYFLVRTNATSGTGIVPTATPDQTSTTIDMSSTTGKIVLVSSTTLLASECSTTNVVDYVGFGGSANCREPQMTGNSTTQNAPAPSSTTQISRVSGGVVDRNVNSIDFTTTTCAAGVLRSGTSNSANPVVGNIDGTAESNYGTALAVQAVQTHFGNATTVTTAFADGSELDQGFGIICNNTLYLTLAGNLQSNNNRIYVFVDSVSGGQNRLRGDNPMPLQRWGDCSGTNGMQFDSGFDADNWFSVNINAGTFEMFVDTGTLPTATGGTTTFLGSTTTAAGGNGVLGGGTNPNGVRATINNSNTAGVGSCTCPCGAASGSGVTTGLELAIPLAAIGNPTGPVRVMAIVANNDVNNPFLSNQVLGAVPNNYCNLGDPRGACGGAQVRNFASDTGDQFFSVAYNQPVITTQPTGTSICSGLTAVLSVVATGTSLNYYWQASTDGGVNWFAANGSGQTTASLTTGTLSATTRYRVIIGNSCTSVTSAEAVVTVNSLPSTPTGTTTYIGSIGTPITMTVATTGGATADWSAGTCGGVNVSGGTGTLSLTVTPAAIGTTVYFVRARDPVTGCTSGGGTPTCLQITLSVPPSNDNCSGAIAITGPYTGGGVTATGNLLGATAEASQITTFCTGGSGTMGTKPGVWYTFTGTGTQVRVDLCSTSPAFDSVLYVLCGSCNGLSCVGSNDDSTANSCTGNLSNVTVSTASGTTYYVWVGPFSTVPSSNFTLRITDTGLANGTLVTCAPVCTLTPPGGATAEVEPCTIATNVSSGAGANAGCDGTLAATPPQNLGSVASSVSVTGSARANATSASTTFFADIDWYTFTIPANDTVLLTGQAQFPANVSIRDLGLSPGACAGTTVGTALTPAGCTSFSTSAALVAGRTYAIRIANTSSNINAFGCGGSNYFFTIQVGVPTPPSGTGARDIATVAQGCQTLLTVTPISGSNPPSSGYSVTGNLSQIGGSASQQFFDDGSNGDVLSGDNIFSYRATVAGGTTSGSKTLTFTVNDAQSRTSGALNFPALTVSNYYTVTPATGLTGIAGATVTLSTVVTANPTASGLNGCTAPTAQAVSINLSTIGGGSSVAMTEGPVGTWTVSYTIPGAQPEAAYTLPVTITDGQSRTASANLSFTVGYCIATSSACGTTDERISQVQFNTINNPAVPNTGAGPSGCYTNFTSISTNVQRTLSYAITVRNAGPFSGDLCSVYVDWNQNGILNDTGETTVLTGSGTSNAQTFAGNITVPAGATLGNTRMRVRLTYTTGQAACGNSSFGETEDYTLSVQAAPSFTVAATPAPSPSSVPQGCTSVISATLGGTYAAPVTVTADLTSIGGGSSVTMTETPANSGIFVLTATVTPATSTGAKVIPISAIDNLSATASTVANLTVTSGAITVTTNSPIVTTAGSTICLQSTLVTPACLPIVSGTNVTVNLTSIGGSSSFALADTGSTPGCDDTAGDLIYGANYTIPMSGVLGVFSLPVTITEPGGRTATASISVTVRPPNDECAGAITLPDGTTTGLSNAGASTSLPTWGCVATSAQNDVWFKYTTCAAGTMVIDTCGSRNSDSGNGIDTVLQVFSGTCASLTSVGCNDDHSSTITGCATTATADSRVSFTATAGTTYYIRIARYSTNGNDKFNVRIFGPQVGDPTAPGASPATICQGSSSSISATVGSGGDEVQWFTGSCGGSLVGTGASLSVSPSVTTTYFARSRNSVSNCTSTGCVSVTVTVITPPTADAGLPQTICASGTATLAGSASNAASTTWSTPGDGTFDDASLLGAVYTPGPNDKANGSVILTLTANANSPCVSATSQVVITIQPLPAVSAGGGASAICAGATIALSGSASFTGGFSWGTTGDGTFDNANSLTAIYTPGSADISSGSVTLTLTGLAVAPCTGSTSSSRTVTINPTTVIGMSPTSQSKCVNDSVTFTVSATGAGLSYQWRKDGLPVGANSPSYSIASIVAADAGSYDCVVSGTCGSATSSAATLTVKALTAIGTQPPSTASQCNGTGTAFGLSAAGSMLTYLWEQSTDNGMTWGPAPGSNTSASYTTSGAAVNGTLFRCTVGGECGPSVISNIVTLTVNDVPTIDTQPASSISACVGQMPALSVAASGYAPLSYAWEYSTDAGMTWNPAPGANTLATYTLQAVVAGDAGNQYRVQVSNPCGTTTSNVSSLSLGGSVNLALSVELQGAVAGPFNRCITVTLFDGNCPGGTSYNTLVTFTGGLGSANIALSGCSSYTGITVRDAQHTLRRSALSGSAAFDTSNPNNLVADFTTATGKRLIGGNVNDDDFVDILDFGGFVGQNGTSPGPVSCPGSGLHADFSGDGVVGPADFTFISSNFLQAREVDPCGQPIVIDPNQPGGPVTSIEVAALVQAGMWNTARADLNRDWKLSSADIIFAMDHGVPTCVADFNGAGGVSIQDIFDFLAAWMGGHPAADVNRNGSVGVQDLFDYLAAWFSGC